MSPASSMFSSSALTTLSSATDDEAFVLRLLASWATAALARCLGVEDRSGVGVGAGMAGAFGVGGGDALADFLDRAETFQSSSGSASVATASVGAASADIGSVAAASVAAASVGAASADAASAGAGSVGAASVESTPSTFVSTPMTSMSA